MRPKNAADAAVAGRDAVARAMNVGMGISILPPDARTMRDAAREGPLALRMLAGIALRGDHAGALMDELAERLAFARATVRLYDALLVRLGTAARLTGGATRARIEQLMREEQSHVELARDAIAALGGDPALVTVGAEVEAVLALGLQEVLGAARVDLSQHLRAIVMAELAGEDGWMVLTTLARLLEREDLARRFESAWLRDKRHARTVRRWAARARRERMRPPTAAPSREIEHSRGP